MKTYIPLIASIAFATTVAYAQETGEKPKKPKRPAAEQIFKKLDTDGNGSLSLEEFKASPRGKKNPEMAEKAFTKLDTDSSASLSLEEFKAGLQKGKKKKDDAAG